MAQGFKNVGFMPEDYELLARLRDKLKEKKGIRMLSLADAAVIAIKEKLAQMDAEQAG
jgi:hypothetical protein